MSPEQRTLARHALGLDNPNSRGRSYRNRYFTSPNTNAEREFKRMVADGCAMPMTHGGEGDPPGFVMTRKGAEMALNDGESLDPEDFP